MSQPQHQWTASERLPVVVFYCKAGLPTGETVRVAQGGTKTSHRGVTFVNVSGEMIHGNSTGAAKASGARCVFRATAGTITEAL